MHVLLDTNVVLDVFLRRDPWVEDASLLWRAVERGEIEASLPAYVLTDLHYVVRRSTDAQRARRSVEICLETFGILPIDRNVLIVALSLKGKDFEDDVTIATTGMFELDAIVTRDRNDFGDSETPVFTPSELRLRIERS